MQTTTRFPLICRLLLGLGGVWLGALLVLVVAPFINAYSLAFGIPLVSQLTAVTAIAAILVLFLSVPLSWVLGCAGLLLEWLSRHRRKRKRKLKRESAAGDQRLLANAEQRLSAPGMSRLAASDLELRRQSSCIVHKENSKVPNIGRLR